MIHQPVRLESNSEPAVNNELKPINVDTRLTYRVPHTFILNRSAANKIWQCVFLRSDQTPIRVDTHTHTHTYTHTHTHTYIYIHTNTQTQTHTCAHTHTHTHTHTHIYIYIYIYIYI